jgi:sugar/nucleoside kinase (ribokinase family)
MQDAIPCSQSFSYDVIAKKRGQEGAVALRGSQMIANQSSIAVTPVDPTGAGDSFTAGFIHGIWSWKLESQVEGKGTWTVDAINEGLRWGCAVGRAAVLIRGASVPPEQQDIKNYYEAIQ